MPALILVRPPIPERAPVRPIVLPAVSMVAAPPKVMGTADDQPAEAPSVPPLRLMRTLLVIMPPFP